MRKQLDVKPYVNNYFFTFTTTWRIMMRIKLTFLCLMLLAVLTANVQGAHVYWVGGVDNEFGLGDNWSAGYPTESDIGVMASGTATLNPGDETPPNAMSELWMAGGANPGVAEIDQSTSTINVTNWVIIGQGYGGDTAGDATPGGTAILNLSGTAVFNQVAGGGGDTHIAETSGGITTKGYLNLSGSAIYNNNHGRFNMGVNTGALGYVTIKENATLNLNNEWHQLGFTGGVAQVTQDGGTVNVNASAAPEVDDANGWDSVGHLVVGGWGGSCTYDLNAGKINTAGGIVLSDADAGFVNTYGIFNLNGGTLTTPGVQAGFVGTLAQPPLLRSISMVVS